MGSYKAPGPDEIQAVFFKKSRHILGEVVHSFVLKAVKDGDVSEEATAATLVLIPKGTNPGSKRGFRPMCLCNVTYKVASKIIVNRLMGIMKELI